MRQPQADGWARRWLGRFRRSLALKLALLFMLLAGALSVTFVLGMRTALGSGWRQVVQPLVADYVDRLAAEIGSPPDPARAQALAERLPLAIRISGPRVQWSSSRGPAHAGAGEPGQPGPQGRHGFPMLPVPGHAPTAQDDAEPAPGPRDADRREWLRRHTADGHTLTFGLDVQAWAEQPRRIGWITLTGLLLLTALTWFVVHRLFRPIGDIGAGAQRYGRGDFSQAIPVRRPDELGELAGRVNTMAADLSGMLEAKRTLLLAISHELRSPLTRARLNAELVAEGPERDALLRDLGQMRDLISDLLESERLAQPHATLQREPTALAALLDGVIQAHFAEQPPTLALPEGLPPAEVDRARLALLLRNLLDNARRHAPGAPVTVSARWADGWLHLDVRDHGPGVPPQLLGQLAEPFYRPDAARQRATGGVGLGLHLCRQVAQAHGGQLLFEDAAPGLRVRLSLPWVAARSAAPAPG